MSGAAVFPFTRLDAARLDHFGGVLARAFHDYPMFRALFPDEVRREEVLRWYMGFILRYSDRYGKVIAAEGDEGVLTCIAGDPVTRVKLALAGLLSGPLRMGLGPFRRMMQHNNYVAHASARVVPADAWYLWMVGVDPAARNKRLGWKLTSSFLAAADTAGAACHGDTDRREMLGFLAFHGFDVVHEGQVPSTGLPFWVVVRPARPPGTDR